MSTEDISIPVNPEVFGWLRKSSGWTCKDVSDLLGIPISSIYDWERGLHHPHLSHLKKLAKEYKRPVAAFLLPEPENDPVLPEDFRMLPASQDGLSKEVLLKIREAQNQQDKSNELMINLDIDLEPDILPATLKDDPEVVAAVERDRMGLSVQAQRAWKDYYAAFRYLRERIESKNIFVFQISADVEQLRGFTLMEIKPFAIVVNSSDVIQARIFTLLHEYAHLLLNRPAMCIPEEEFISKEHRNIIEKWCNAFAAAFLLPAEDVKRDFGEMGIENYRKLAHRYHASYCATLTRLYILNCISREEYNVETHKFPELLKETGGKNSGYGLNSAKKAERDKGHAFISLVFENMENGFITGSEALDYLNIRTRHLDELTNF